MESLLGLHPTFYICIFLLYISIIEIYIGGIIMENFMKNMVGWVTVRVVGGFTMLVIGNILYIIFYFSYLVGIF